MSINILQPKWLRIQGIFRIVAPVKSVIHWWYAFSLETKLERSACTYTKVDTAKHQRPLRLVYLQERGTLIPLPQAASTRQCLGQEPPSPAVGKLSGSYLLAFNAPFHTVPRALLNASVPHALLVEDTVPRVLLGERALASRDREWIVQLLATVQLKSEVWQATKTIGEELALIQVKVFVLATWSRTNLRF